MLSSIIKISPIIVGLLIINALNSGDDPSPLKQLVDGQSIPLNQKELKVRSPAISSSSLKLPKIARRYKCHPEEIWLPLRWSRVPKGTRELGIAMMWNALKQEGRRVESTLSEIWIVGGLDPKRQRLPVGSLPAGAFLNSHHSSVCPLSGKASGIVITVYALPDGDFLRDFEAVDLDTVEGLDRSALAKGVVAGIYGRLRVTE